MSQAHFNKAFDTCSLETHRVNVASCGEKFHQTYDKTSLHGGLLRVESFNLYAESVLVGQHTKLT